MSNRLSLGQKNIIEFCLGSLILSIGVALSFTADLGVSAFDAISYNIADTFGIDLGIAFMISSVIIILISLLISNDKKVLLSLVSSVLIGGLISLLEKGFQKILPVDYVILIIIYLVFGGILIGIGAVLMIDSTYFPSAVDVFIKSIHQRFNLKIGLVKYLSEIIFLIIALMIALYHRSFNPDAGFGIGWGTIVLFLLVGIVMELTFRYLERSRHNENKQID